MSPTILPTTQPTGGHSLIEPKDTGQHKWEPICSRLIAAADDGDPLVPWLSITDTVRLPDRL